MRIKAFTMAEMLITILMISIAMIVMAPVMTKKAKQPLPQVVVKEGQTLPKGAIILYYGDDIPDGWQECSGQSLDGEEFKELKVNAENYSYLPDLNQLFQATDTNLKWIIKVKK